MIVPLVNMFKLNSKNLVRAIEVSQLILYFQIIYQVILKVSTIDLKIMFWVQWHKITYYSEY